MNDTGKMLEHYQGLVERQRAEIGKRIIGQSKLIEALFICFYAHSERKLGPHLLVEGQVGQGKTATLDTSSRTIAGATFSRIQFTPDLRPLDLLRIVEQHEDRTLEFHPGPLFAIAVLNSPAGEACRATLATFFEARRRSSILTTTGRSVTVRTKTLKITGGLALVLIVFLAAAAFLWPGERVVAVPQPLPAGKPIVVTTRSDRLAVRLDDPFWYYVDVWYDPARVAGIDRVTLAQKVNLKPFEVCTTPRAGRLYAGLRSVRCGYRGDLSRTSRRGIVGKPAREPGGHRALG